MRPAINEWRPKNEKKQLLKHLAGTFRQAQTFKLGGVIAAYIILVRFVPLVIDHNPGYNS